MKRTSTHSGSHRASAAIAARRQMRTKWPRRAIALAVFLAALPAPAQDAPSAMDPMTIAIPNLAFEPTREDERNFDKYSYFHRAGTDFVTALADIQECDFYARGVPYNLRGGLDPVGSTIIGGPVAAAIFDATIGAGMRRKIRRANMRTCMRFKGYSVFGLSKTIWEQFNTEQSPTRFGVAEYQRLLTIQARIASGPRPQTPEIAE